MTKTRMMKIVMNSTVNTEDTASDAVHFTDWKNDVGFITVRSQKGVERSKSRHLLANITILRRLQHLLIIFRTREACTYRNEVRP